MFLAAFKSYALSVSGKRMQWMLSMLPPSIPPAIPAVSFVTLESQMFAPKCQRLSHVGLRGWTGCFALSPLLRRTTSNTAYEHFRLAVMCSIPNARW